MNKSTFSGLGQKFGVILYKKYWFIFEPQIKSHFSPLTLFFIVLLKIAISAYTHLPVHALFIGTFLPHRHTKKIYYIRTTETQLGNMFYPLPKLNNLQTVSSTSHMNKFISIQPKGFQFPPFWQTRFKLRSSDIILR